MHGHVAKYIYCYHYAVGWVSLDYRAQEMKDDPIDYRASAKKYPCCNCYEETAPNKPKRKNKEGADCILWESLGFSLGGTKHCPAFYCKLCIYESVRDG